MSETHDIKDRHFDAGVYDKEYFVGSGSKSGYTDYATCKGIVTDQFQIIHDVMWPRVSGDGEATIHVDVACAYGHSIAKMKNLGWVSVGGDISEFAIAEGKKMYGEDFEINVSDARNDSFWKGFDKVQAIDLVTACEFFEHIATEDVEGVVKHMAESARWGAFCINGRTAPGQDEDAIDGDHGHLNNHNMSYWVTMFAKYGEIDFEAMYALNKRSEAYNPDVHWHCRWIVVKFKEVVIE